MIKKLWYDHLHMPLLEISGNILIPALSGLILFILFLYFAFIEESRSSSTKYFTLFLISFSIFLFGRPVQILSGAHPVPLIINNIRSLIFASVTIPMVILADFSRPPEDRLTRYRPLFFAGMLLGLIYGVFNTLSTTGSEVIFTIGSFRVFDSVTPRRYAPWYGREVTIGVYMTLAAILFTDSVLKIRRAGSYREKGEVQLKRVYLYNTGKIIFALTFFGGSLLHQWWIYYVGSLASVFFLGYGVSLEIRENRRRMDKVISYIREDLIQDLSLDVHRHQQVTDMLDLLQISGEINTFIVLRAPAVPNREGFTGISETLVRETTALLEKILGKNRFILMTMGTDMLGLCLSCRKDPQTSRMKTTGLCETLKKSQKDLVNFNIGIGRACSGLKDLKKSYHEAITAVDYASSIEGGQVIHISDIQDEESRPEYPQKEKQAFLTAIRTGDGVKAAEQLPVLMSRLPRYGGEEENLLKVRIYELLGTMIESAMDGGGDVDDLLKLSGKLFAESAAIRSSTQMEDWLRARTEDIIGIVSRSHTNRSQNIIRKAKEYIDAHFAEAISVKDVAHEVCISESYFKSIFKKTSGYSYSEYLTIVRINQAKKLLKTTEKAITEIAMDVGYQTPNSFSALFKRETGMTPTQYKNSSKEP
ncbi:MAG: AraC family transcriptional regulator [Spirochaetales bacterium]|nr:AraC family transcriptional regulator [Spirochaetales bacterium]